MGGLYIKRGYSISYQPDAISMTNLHRSMSLSSAVKFDVNAWSIYTNGRTLVYVNIPEHPDMYIDYPPSTGWVSVKKNASR